MTDQQKPPETNSGSDSDSEFQILGLPEIDDPLGLRSRAPFEILASQYVEELRQGQQLLEDQSWKSDQENKDCPKEN